MADKICQNVIEMTKPISKISEKCKEKETREILTLNCTRIQQYNLKKEARDKKGVATSQTSCDVSLYVQEEVK